MDEDLDKIQSWSVQSCATETDMLPSAGEFTADQSADTNLCTFCGKTYKKKTSLIIHERKHIWQKPYRCGQCGQMYATNERLIKHQAVHSVLGSPSTSQKDSDNQSVDGAVVSSSSSNMESCCHENPVTFDSADSHVRKGHNSELISDSDGNMIGEINSNVSSMKEKSSVVVEKGHKSKLSSSLENFQEVNGQKSKRHSSDKNRSNLTVLKNGQKFRFATKKANDLELITKNNKNVGIVLRKKTLEKSQNLSSEKNSGVPLAVKHGKNVGIVPKKNEEIPNTLLEKKKDDKLVTRTGKNMSILKKSKSGTIAENGHSVVHSYSCGICGRGFNRPNYLHLHMRQHSVHYKCENCKKTFYVLENFRKHLTICGNVTKMKDVFFENKNGELNYWPQKFDNGAVNRMDDDMVSGFESPEREFRKQDRQNVQVHTCAKCGKRFFDYGNLKKHIRVCNTRTPEKFEIAVYGEVLPRLPVVKEVKKHGCDKCGKLYLRLGDLKNHEVSCDKISASKNSERKVEMGHKRSSMGKTGSHIDKTREDTLAGKRSFFQKLSMVKKCRNYGPVRRGKKFDRDDNLIEHLEDAGVKSNLRSEVSLEINDIGKTGIEKQQKMSTFRCDFCGKQFVRAGSHRVTCRKMYLDKIEPNKQKDHGRNSNSLNKGLIEHPQSLPQTKESTHSCNKCGRAFMLKRNLGRHLSFCRFSVDINHQSDSFSEETTKRNSILSKGEKDNFATSKEICPYDSIPLETLSNQPGFGIENPTDDGFYIRGQSQLLSPDNMESTVTTQFIGSADIGKRSNVSGKSSSTRGNDFSISPGHCSSNQTLSIGSTTEIISRNLAEVMLGSSHHGEIQMDNNNYQSESQINSNIEQSLNQMDSNSEHIEIQMSDNMEQNKSQMGSNSEVKESQIDSNSEQSESQMGNSKEQSESQILINNEQSDSKMGISKKQSESQILINSEQNTSQMGINNEQLESLVGSNNKHSKSQMNSNSEQSQSQMDSNCEQSESQMDSNSEQSESQMDSNSKQSGCQMSIISEQLESQMDSNSEQSESQVGSNSEELESQRDSNGEQSESQMDSNSEQSESQLSINSEQLESQMDSNSEQSESQMDNNSEQSESQMDSNSEQSESQVGSNSEQLESQMDSNSEQSESQMDSNSEQHKSQMGSNREQCESLMDSNSEQSESQMDSNSEQGQSQVGSSSEQSESQIGISKEQHESQMCSIVEQNKSQIDIGKEQNESQMFIFIEQLESQMDSNSEQCESQMDSNSEQSKSQISISNEQSESQMGSNKEQHDSQMGISSEQQEGQNGINIKQSESQMGSYKEQHESQIGSKEEQHESQMGSNCEQHKSKLGINNEQNESQMSSRGEQHESQMGSVSEQNKVQININKDHNESQIESNNEHSKSQMGYDKEKHESQMNSNNEQSESYVDSNNVQHESRMNSNNEHYESQMDSNIEQHESQMGSKSEQHESPLGINNEQNESQMSSIGEQHESQMGSVIEQNKIQMDINKDYNESRIGSSYEGSESQIGINSEQYESQMGSASEHLESQIEINNEHNKSQMGCDNEQHESQMNSNNGHNEGKMGSNNEQSESRVGSDNVQYESQMNSSNEHYESQMGSNNEQSDKERVGKSGHTKSQIRSKNEQSKSQMVINSRQSESQIGSNKMQIEINEKEMPTKPVKQGVSSLQHGEHNSMAAEENVENVSTLGSEIEVRKKTIGRTPEIRMTSDLQHNVDRSTATEQTGTDASSTSSQFESEIISGLPALQASVKSKKSTLQMEANFDLSDFQETTDRMIEPCGLKFPNQHQSDETCLQILQYDSNFDSSATSVHNEQVHIDFEEVGRSNDFQTMQHDAVCDEQELRHALNLPKQPSESIFDLNVAANVDLPVVESESSSDLPTLQFESINDLGRIIELENNSDMPNLQKEANNGLSMLHVETCKDLPCSTNQTTCNSPNLDHEARCDMATDQDDQERNKDNLSVFKSDDSGCHGNRRFECDMCEKKFTRKCHLAVHRKFHKTIMEISPKIVKNQPFFINSANTGPDSNHGNKQLECDVCGRKVTRLCNLARHKMIHQQINLCEKSHENKTTESSVSLRHCVNKLKEDEGIFDNPLDSNNTHHHGDISEAVARSDQSLNRNSTHCLGDTNEDVVGSGQSPNNNNAYNPGNTNVDKVKTGQSLNSNNTHSHGDTSKDVIRSDQSLDSNNTGCHGDTSKAAGKSYQNKGQLKIQYHSNIFKMKQDKILDNSGKRNLCTSVPETLPRKGLTANKSKSLQTRSKFRFRRGPTTRSNSHADSKVHKCCTCGPSCSDSSKLAKHQFWKKHATSESQTCRNLRQKKKWPIIISYRTKKYKIKKSEVDVGKVNSVGRDKLKSAMKTKVHKNFEKNEVQERIKKSDNLKCETCEKTFAHIGSLRLHKQIHNRVYEKNGKTESVTYLKTPLGHSASKLAKPTLSHFVTPTGRQLLAPVSPLAASSPMQDSLKRPENSRRNMLTLSSTSTVPKKSIRMSVNCSDLVPMNYARRLDLDPSRSSNYKSRMVSVRKETASTSQINKKSFTCNTCFKSFQRPGNLVNHMLEHVREMMTNHIGKKLNFMEDKRLTISFSNAEEGGQIVSVDEATGKDLVPYEHREDNYEEEIERNNDSNFENLSSVLRSGKIIEMHKQNKYSRISPRNTQRTPPNFHQLVEIKRKEQESSKTVRKSLPSNRKSTIKFNKEGDSLKKFPKSKNKRRTVGTVVAKKERTVTNKGRGSSTHNAQSTTHNAQSSKNMCLICDKVFSNRSYMKVHMLIHTGTKPFKCDVCNQSTAHLTSYKRHCHSARHKANSETKVKEIYKKRVNQDRSCRCKICKKSFESTEKLYEHEKIHNTECKSEVQQGGICKCERCEELFTSPVKLSEHVELAHSEVMQRSSKFSRNKTGIKPNLNITRISGNVVKGKQLKSSMSRSYLKEKKSKPQDKGENERANINFSYLKNGDHFSRRSPPKRTPEKTSSVFSEVRKKFICPVCEEEFTKRWSLEIHFRRHSKINSPFICSICNERLDVEVEYRRHMENHSDFRQNRDIEAEQNESYDMEYLDSGVEFSENIEIKECSVILGTKSADGAIPVVDYFQEKSQNSQNVDNEYYGAGIGRGRDGGFANFEGYEVKSVQRKKYTIQSIRQYTCNICSCNFGGIKELRRHVVEHAEAK